MRSSWKITLLLALAASAASLQAQGVHPGFKLTPLRPAGFTPGVGGMDFLPDGRLVVATWDGFGTTKGTVWLVSNATTGDASRVTTTKFATGLFEPLGVSVVNGEIYVLQKNQLSLLPDKNNDGLADEVKKVAGGWTVGPAQSGETQSLEFAMGTVYKDSLFYGGLATAWPLTGSQSAERGCIIQISTKTAGFTNFACGVRTPNGLVLGPDDELFTTENQGNWVPGSKLLHISKGKFYGVHKTPAGPFDNQAETPPAVWIDHGVVGISPTQPVYVKSGVYKGQMFAGDNGLGTLQRYFLEKVGNGYQGAVFRFTSGLEAGANRIITGPDSAIYIGGIGTSAWGGWSWGTRYSGLQRMTETTTKVFDLLAVRSTGATTMELEFTKPVGTGYDVAANYQVRHWSYKPVADYGVGKQTVTNLSASTAKVSDDKLKVTLTISGMKAKDVIYIKLLNNQMKSAANDTCWSPESWYTLNAFGPSTPTVRANPAAPARFPAQDRIHARTLGGGKLGLKIAASGDFSLQIRDIGGRLLETLSGSGSSDLLSEAAYPAGLYLLTLKDASGSASMTFSPGSAN